MTLRRLLLAYLQIVGALATAGLIALLLSFCTSLVGNPRPFDKRELFSVLGDAGADPIQDWSIVQSSRGPRGFAGDHFDYACIQLARAPATRQGWRTEPETDSLVIEALSFALDTAASEGATCFPSLERVNTPGIWRRVIRLVLSDRFPTAVELILYDPSSNRLYYASDKT